ncbi:MAG: WXG100 family type VII secretion target [Chloroflexaceae bacterium]|nr:WXG100 family type VII secretion target [Chloroflexaceae bacterium]
MAEEVRADYDQLEEVASRFANQAEAIQQMLDKVRSSMEALLDGGWIGRGADAFSNEMEAKVLPATMRLQTALDTASAETRNISQIIQQAEDEASAPFRVG